MIRVVASMLNVNNRNNGMYGIEGKADVDRTSDYTPGSNIEIKVGDCNRDGVMPNKDQLEEMEKARKIRNTIQGKANGIKTKKSELNDRAN